MAGEVHFKIVRDKFAGYELQYWRWLWPGWVQVPKHGGVNTFHKIEDAEAFAEAYLKSGRVVRRFCLPAPIPQTGEGAAMRAFTTGFLACYALAWIASSSMLYASQRMTVFDVAWRGGLWPYAITILWHRQSWLGPNREPSHDR